MNVLHFFSGAEDSAVELVAAACRRRGWRQTIVRGHDSGDRGCPEADAMVRLERALLDEAPDVVLLYGDGDVTLAAALAAAKAGVPSGRIEPGRRSGERALRIEANRILIDRLASRLFTASDAAEDLLSGEGATPDRVRRVGPLSGDAAERIADHLDAEAQPAPAGPDLKAPPVERIIEAQL